MNYNESNADLRVIPIYLVDSSGDPATGLTLTGSEVQVSKSGAAFTNGAGSITEVANGYYRYVATQAETATDSFLILKVVDAGLTALPYVYSVDIGTRIEMAESLAAARRLPIYLVDTSGDPVAGLALTAAEVQIAGVGFGFVDAVGTATEIGSGAYYYELDTSEVADEGISILKINDAAARPYIYSFDVVPSSTVGGECGGYIGGYLGMCDDDGGADDDESTPSTPIPAPLTLSDHEYHDHAAHAIKRLCQFAKVATS